MCCSAVGVILLFVLFVTLADAGRSPIPKGKPRTTTFPNVLGHNSFGVFFTTTLFLEFGFPLCTHRFGHKGSWPPPLNRPSWPFVPTKPVVAREVGPHLCACRVGRRGSWSPRIDCSQLCGRRVGSICLPQKGNISFGFGWVRKGRCIYDYPIFFLVL